MTDIRILTDHAYQGKYEDPLAEEFYQCSNCGNLIYEGDYYYEIHRSIICEECIRDFRQLAE